MTSLDTALSDARDKLRLPVLDAVQVIATGSERKSADHVLALVEPISKWGLEAPDLRDLYLRTEAIDRHRINVIAARLDDDFMYVQTPEVFLAEAQKLHAFLMGEPA
ncbi:MAG: hypothetical protein JWQ95_1904 [Sphaerisporangium sp.]|nr:hypothetical protein [Sphaerisporangium sp.]